MVAKKLEEQFIDIMFLFDDENKIIENYSELRKVLSTVKREELPSPYDYITKYVFDQKLENPDEATIMFDYLRGLYIETDGTNGDYVDVTLKSIARHIRLAIIQQNYIAKQTTETLMLNRRLQITLKEQSLSLSNINKSSKDLENRINEMKIDKSSIYTDFIAILGIFSALIFGLFGGFSAFSSLLQAMSSNAKISRAIMMGSLLLIGLLILIFLLLNGVSNLTDRNIKSCCSDQKCGHNIYQRFPIFVLGITVLSIFATGAFLGMVWNLEGELYNKPILVTAIAGLIIFILIISIIVMICNDKSSNKNIINKKQNPTSIKR